VPSERKQPLKLKDNSRVFLHSSSKGCPLSVCFVIYFKLNGGGRNLGCNACLDQDAIHVKKEILWPLYLKASTKVQLEQMNLLSSVQVQKPASQRLQTAIREGREFFRGEF